METVRVRLGPVPTAAPAGYLDSLVGTEVKLPDGGAAGTVMNAWAELEHAIGGHDVPMIMADIQVDDEMARLLFQPVDGLSIMRKRPDSPVPFDLFESLHEWRNAPSNTASAPVFGVEARAGEPVRITAVEQFEKLYGSTYESLKPYAHLFGMSDEQLKRICHVRDRAGVYTGGPTYKVTRYGGTHTIARVWRGGFRTRYRVQWARALWQLVRDWRGYASAGLEAIFEQQHEHDRQRVCPHREEWWRRLGDTGWERCDACGDARKAVGG